MVARFQVVDLRTSNRAREYGSVPVRHENQEAHAGHVGYLADTQPTFDTEGKYLFYASDREFEPVYGSFDNSWTYPNPTRIVAVPLRKNVKSPLAARNDSENPLLDTNDKDDAKKDDSRKDDSEKARRRGQGA